MKDMPWRKYLVGPEKKFATEAYEKELTAMLTTKRSRFHGPDGKGTSIDLSVNAAFAGQPG